MILFGMALALLVLQGEFHIAASAVVVLDKWLLQVVSLLFAVMSIAYVLIEPLFYRQKSEPEFLVLIAVLLCRP